MFIKTPTQTDAFSYSTKIWVGSLLCAPVIALTWSFIIGPDHSNFTVIVPISLLFSTLEGIFSVLTWLTFWVLIKLILISIHKRKLRRWIILITGISLTLITFWLFIPDILPFSPFCITLIISNCICIGGGCWYFKLDTG